MFKTYQIVPPKGLVHIDLNEIWRFRELFAVFVWRDLKVRYKQTILGILWAILQPFLAMVVFSIFFGSLAKMPSEGTPYPIFVYSGLLLWNYFSTAINSSSSCLIDNENIIKKVYFPRLILPLSTTITPIVDFIFSMIVLLCIMWYYHFTPNIIGILILPILIFMTFVSASGIGLFLAAFNAKYRDVRYVLPFFIQMLLFVTPVIYPVSMIPQNFQWVLYLNPMSGIITIARSTLLNTNSVEWELLLLSLGSGLLCFLIGISYFRKTERFFADVL